MDFISEYITDLVEDVVLDLVLNTHCNAKLASRVCHHCGQKCKEFGDSFKSNLNLSEASSSSSETVQCKRCEKGISARLYARHLEKCMGLQGARGSQRRSGNSSNNDGFRPSPEKILKKISTSKKSRDSTIITSSSSEKHPPKRTKKSNLPSSSESSSTQRSESSGLSISPSSIVTGFTYLKTVQNPSEQSFLMLAPDSDTVPPPLTTPTLYPLENSDFFEL